MGLVAAAPERGGPVFSQCLAVAGAGEIVAGTVVGGIAGVGFGVIGDLGIQSGFNLISLGEIISPAKADDLPIGNQPVVPAICR